MHGMGQWESLHSQEVDWKCITERRQERVPPWRTRGTLRVGLWGLMGPLDTYREKQPNHNFPSPLTIVIWALCSVSLFCPQGIGSGPDKTWGQPYMGWSRNAGHTQQGDPPGQTTHSNPLSIQFLFWTTTRMRCVPLRMAVAQANEDYSPVDQWSPQLLPQPRELSPHRIGLLKGRILLPPQIPLYPQSQIPFGNGYLL